MGAENEAEQAALKIQAIRRGSRARGEYKDTRDEEARRQWVEYYVQTGNYAEARELGWDDGDANAPGTPGSASDPPAPVARAESDVTTGPIAITDDDEREKAARLMQAHMRGSSARLQYRDKRDDEARSQWISYYLALGDLESARELGWDEADEEQAKAATALAKVRRGQLARRSLAGSVAIPGAMPFPDLPKPSNVDDEAAPAEEQAAAPAAEEAAPATPERLPNLTAAEREAFVEAEREAFGGKTENEMALEAAQEGAPIFSARWFGKVWDGMLSPDKGKGGAEGGDPETAEETEEARRAKQMEEKAAILVQCWCRVVLAKVAVKNEGRKYRLLALYAHVEEKNANKIQAAFRNRRPSAVATGESAGSASEDVASASYAANYETKGDAAPDAAPDAASDAVSDAALCAVSITLVLPGHNDPSSPTHCHVSVTPILSPAELASKTSELIAELAAAQAASARTSAALAVSSAPEVTDAQAASSSSAPEVSTLCTDAQTSPSRTAPPEGLPPTEAKKPTTAPRLAGLLGRAGGPDLERKIAEIKANHAATVMQKLHRDASKREVCKSLQGVLYKRSQGLPMFFRRSAYISTDGYSLVYRSSKNLSTDGARNARASAADNAKDAERRIPLASITAIALESELYLEFSVDSTIRGKKFLFRCSSRADLQMWLNGLADLTP